MMNQFEQTSLTQQQDQQARSQFDQEYGYEDD